MKLAPKDIWSINQWILFVVSVTGQIPVRLYISIGPMNLVKPTSTDDK